MRNFFISLLFFAIISSCSTPKYLSDYDVRDQVIAIETSLNYIINAKWRRVDPHKIYISDTMSFFFLKGYMGADGNLRNHKEVLEYLCHGCKNFNFEEKHSLPSLESVALNKGWSIEAINNKDPKVAFYIVSPLVPLADLKNGYFIQIRSGIKTLFTHGIYLKKNEVGEFEVIKERCYHRSDS